MSQTTRKPAAPSAGDGQPARAPSPPGRWDAEAFSVRLQESARVLWTVAAGVLGDRSGVDDVLQEAALIGLQKLDQFDPDSNFTAWMGRIVRFVALNQVRARTRRRTHPSDPVQLDREPGLARDVAVREGAAVDARGQLIPGDDVFDDELAGALAELKPMARSCLLLKTLLGLEYQEIARSLDIPLGTAVSHVHRARRFLRRRLESGPASTPGAAGNPRGKDLP